MGAGTWSIEPLPPPAVLEKKQNEAMDKTSALVLIDFQNDFFPFGTVEAMGAGADMVAAANSLMERFGCVIGLCDEHPGDHSSFAANHLWRRPWQTMHWEGHDILLWPLHGVAGSFGAEWTQGLHTQKITRIFGKGMHPDAPGYSGFENNALERLLREQGIERLYLMGPLLEYSVKHTALDARSRSFDVAVIRDGCGMLELHPGDGGRAWQDMIERGVGESGISDII